MHGMKFMMLLWVAGALIGSGCTSMRVTTNLKPEADPVLRSSAGKFYVSGLKYSVAKPDANLQKGFGGITVGENRSARSKYVQGDASFERNLLSLVREECTARYPALFADDSSTAIPIGVEVRNTTTLYNKKSAAWMLGTALLSGLIFPNPGDMELDVDVTVGLWNGRDGMGSGTIERSFRNKVHYWMSLLTPLGLIPVPGESDFPKGSAVDPIADVHVAQQVATAIAKLVVAKDPAFWTTPAQGQATHSAPQALPAALPVPKEFATPF